jgi:hypothetical protein
MGTTPPPVDPQAQLQADLQLLQSAIASGVTEVRFQDRTIRYASVKEMIAASNYIYQLLYGTGQNRQIRIYTNKGL